MVEQVSVIWCGYCHKPFTKQSSLKRHEYYCRSKTKTSVSKGRPCASCAKAKIKCDTALPKCSRCYIKGSVCHYPPKSVARRRNAVDARRATSNRLQDPSRELASTAISDEIDQVQDQREIIPANGNSILLTGRQWNLSSVEGFANIMQLTPELPTPSVTSSFPSASFPSASFPSASDDLSIVLPSSTVSNTTDSAAQQRSHLTHRQQQQNSGPELLDFSIPPVPISNIRHMVQRPVMNPGLKRCASLMFSTLSSYPRMLRQDILPPLIHASNISLTNENIATETLGICISLMHMTRSVSKGSRKLFWQNVRQECQRICDQSRTFSKWELLGSMQALTIYLLIRLDEGETEHNNIDYLLERAVVFIAIRFSDDETTCHAQHESCHHKSKCSWEDWIYRECRRRIAVIYRVLNKLIFFGPAAICSIPHEFVIAPLPAKRQLWEATDPQEWEMQIKKESQEQVAYALGVDGELVKLDPRRLSCRDTWLPFTPLDDATSSSGHESASNGNADGWTDWCTTMDSMGGLILLAAAVV